MEIWKYEIPIEDRPCLQLPLYHKVLCVKEIDNIPYLYILCNSENKLCDYYFKIYGTGHHCFSEIDDYIGTVSLKTPSGFNLVWHIFHY